MTGKILYLIDGSSFIFRAYFALPKLTNSKGFPTSAIYGFNNMLQKLIREKNPHYLGVVFDRPEPTFRKEAFAAYKAQREEMPGELAQQIPYIKKLVEAWNLTCLELPGFEADDIIGTLAKRFTDIPMVVVTGDKDLMQLVDKRVSLYDPMKDKNIGEKEVLEKFGVSPQRVIEVLGLAGDTSDNIPGVQGIGPKTAANLIQTYGNIEAVYANLDKIKGKQKERLEQDKAKAFLSKKLATLHTDVPLTCTLDALERKPPHEEQLQALYQEFEFTRLLQNTPPKPSSDSFEQLPKANYHLVDSEPLLTKLIEQLTRAKNFSFDTETDSLVALQANLVGLSFAVAPGEAYYLPVGHHTSQPLKLKETLEQLKPLFANPDLTKVAQNFKYDAHVLMNYGIEVRGLSMDTMIASYLLDPASSHSLDFLAQHFLNHRNIPFSQVVPKTKTFADVELNLAKDYSCEDADVTLRLSQLFVEKLPQEQLTSMLHDIELPTTYVLLKMERAGIKIDIDFLQGLKQEYQQKLTQIETEIFQLAGTHFNIQSPKQLGKILFETLTLPTQKKNKTGFSTDVSVLEELAKIHPLPQKILDYRSLAKLISTYIDALPQQVNPHTGRVHTTYNQTIAETGRLSSTDPNLQNIPIRTEEGRKIRRAFITEPGWVLLSADYSQIELRILAHLSEDPELLSAFQQNLDVHRLTAAKIFNIDPQTVTNEQRAIAKTVNFGVIYGQTPYGLSSQLKIPQSEAKLYIDQYFQKYQKVKTYRDQVLMTARQTKEVRTLLGRRRHVPDIEHRNQALRQMAERFAFNTVLQGTAADIIKLAMIRLDQKLTSTQSQAGLLLQVHDELVVESPQAEIPQVKEMIREAMEGVYPMKVALKVSIGVGPNWDEAH